MTTVLDAGLSLLATLELDLLPDPLLAALTSASGAQGGALFVAEGAGALVLTALRGLVDARPLPARIDPAAGERSAALLHGKPFQDSTLAPGGAELVPLVDRGRLVGLAVLEAPSMGPESHAELTRMAALALGNARRVVELRRASGAPANSEPRIFRDYAEKELWKARRYGRCFSLAVVGVEGLRAQGGDRALELEVGAALGRAVREADVLAPFDGFEHQVLLPETDAFGALAFLRRATEEMRRQPSLIAPEGPLRPSFGSASYPGDGESLDDLLLACRARMEERRGSLLVTLRDDLREDPDAFWELFDALLGEVTIPVGSPSARLALAPELVEGVAREALREIARDTYARRVLYLGSFAREASWASLIGSAFAPRTSDAEARVYLLGPAEAGGAALPLVTRVPVSGDRRLVNHAFVFLLSQRASYALLAGPGGRVFHTADGPLVEALVAKLQKHYDLEPL